jgi:hypothetical protein
MRLLYVVPFFQSAIRLGALRSLVRRRVLPASRCRGVVEDEDGPVLFILPVLLVSAKSETKTGAASKGAERSAVEGQSLNLSYVVPLWRDELGFPDSSTRHSPCPS